MSRFFRSVSDSESESSEEEELLSESEESGEETKPKKKAKGSDVSESSEEEEASEEDEDEKEPEVRRPTTSRFLRGDTSEDDSSDEDERRVVKSAKDKRIEEMEACAKTVDNAVKINDWTVISNEFDKLTRLVQRPADARAPPVLYYKAIVSLENALADASSAASKKKLNATNARALNGMKQKLKKTQRENEEALNSYKEDPEAFQRQADEALATAEGRRKAPKQRAAATLDEGEGDDFTLVGRGGRATVVTADNVLKELLKVMEARGKKNTNRTEQSAKLAELLRVAATPYSRIRVLLALISSLFDYNSAAHPYMPLDSWVEARSHLDLLLRDLATQPQYVISEAPVEYDELEDRTSESMVQIRGSIISLVERLDDEFTRSLQNIDPHSVEYIERLAQETQVYETIVQAQLYFEQANLADPLARVIFRRLEHVYYKPDIVTRALERNISTGASLITPFPTMEEGSLVLVHALCVHLYKADASLLRTRAMLCHIFHHALHEDFYSARDMLLMSHLQETVHGADVGTQILYNRTVVQLGLCAFRLGLIKESQNILQEVFSTLRVKELLAQGFYVQKFTTLTPEQERQERQRQLPFHMHVNIELLECVYLVSSMLLEVPNMAQAGDDPDAKKRVISRTFRRMLDYADRQVFVGPPESKRDHVMQAAKALQAGNWKKSAELIHSIKIWNLLPGEAQVKEMLTDKIKEQGLKAYLYAHAALYSSISLGHLGAVFSLPISRVSSIVSKLIWADNFPASLDQLSGVVIFQRVQLSRLQQLSVTLADKASWIADQNERALDSRLGTTNAEAQKTDHKEDGGGPRRGERRTRGGRGGGQRNPTAFSHGLGGVVAR